MSDVMDFPVAYIGTPSFVPLLLKYVRNAAAGLPIEPVVFQSILICLISGNKHLILRTAEDDVGLVAKLAVKTLATIFGILTHRLRIHRRTSHDPTSSVSAFLRSLFISTSGGSLPTLVPDETTGHGHRKYRKRPGSGSRSHSATVRSMGSQYSRASELTSAKSTAPSLSATDPFGNYQSPGSMGIAASFNSTSRNSSLSAIPHPAFPHSYSDPTPLGTVRDPALIQLPGALVVSGLEHASLASQRALTAVLAEGSVVLTDTSHSLETPSKGKRQSKSTLETDVELSGVWPLPKDFILVYVCPLDERERPSIHKPLLVKFAMSATVSLHPTIRSASKSFFLPVSQSYRGTSILSPVPQVASNLPNSTPPLSQPPPPHRHISPATMTPSNGSQTVITSDAMKLLQEIYQKVHVPSTLNLYISDLFSAARHHHQLEGRLLSISAMNDAFELSRAARVLGGDLTGVEVINNMLNTDSKSTTDNGGSDDERLSKAMPDTGSAFVVIDPLETRLSADEGQENPDEEVIPVLDVTEANIARIFPRVLSHRLRVRDGPEEEVLAGAIFGASFSVSLQKEERGRKLDRERNRVTVKELLVGILQDV